MHVLRGVLALMLFVGYSKGECPANSPPGTVEREDTGDCYYAVLGSGTAKSRDNAAEDCQSFGMSLLSIRSEEEQQWIQTQFPEDYEFVWLSATETSGAWTWLDGSTLREQACRSLAQQDSDVSQVFANATTVTNSECRQMCADADLSFAALQFVPDTDFVICKCGDTFANTAGRQMKDCDDPCPADASQWCGDRTQGYQLVVSTQGTDAQFWAASQPNYFSNYQGCLALASSSREYKIQDETCHDTTDKYYICQHDNLAACSASSNFILGDKCISVNEVELTWFEAAAACRSQGGHLVTLSSREEWQDLTNNNLVQRTTDKAFWIGARSRFWTWAEGDEMVYDNWVFSQPDEEAETCAALERFAGGDDVNNHYKWQDADCTQLNSYICKLSAMTTMPAAATTPTTASTVPHEASTVPPAASTMPPAASTMPPAASTMSPAGSTMPPTASSMPPAASNTPPTGSNPSIPDDSTDAQMPTDEPQATSAGPNPGGSADSQEGSSSSSSDEDDDDVKIGVIVAVVIVAVIVALVLLRLIYYCCQRGRTTEKGGNSSHANDAYSYADSPNYPSNTKTGYEEATFAF